MLVLKKKNTVLSKGNISMQCQWWGPLVQDQGTVESKCDHRRV